MTGFWITYSFELSIKYVAVPQHGLCSLSLRADSRGVPSPTFVSMSQWRQSPHTWASRHRQNRYYYHQSWILIISCRKIARHVWRVGSRFLLDPTLNRSPTLVSRKCCLVTSLSYFRPLWSGKSQRPCSQWMRLHGLTSSDLERRTWDPCEPALSLEAHQLQNGASIFYGTTFGWFTRALRTAHGSWSTCKEALTYNEREIIS